jgi:HSP20 family molecular chaperone IbpA
MAKKKKNKVERKLEELKKEIAEKGKEIEQLKKTTEEMRTQIQGKEKTDETVELGKVFDDVSELLDVGFNIFGTSGKIQGGKSSGKGLFGLINDLAKLAEKSQTYQKRVNLGKRGVVDFRVSSRPIKGSYTTKPKSRLKISKPKSKTPPTRTPMPSPTDSIEEKESIVDVFEEDDHIKVMAEVPGVEEKDIKLKIKDDRLTISVDASEKKYFKEVKLPTSVEKDSVESAYRNGVLEVKLRKTKDTREKDA